MQVHLRGENDFTSLQTIRNADGQAIIVIFHELLAEIVRPGSKISIDYGRIVLSVTEVVQAQSGQRQKRPSVPGSPSHQSMYQHSGSSSIKAQVIAADAVLKSNQVRPFGHLGVVLVVKRPLMPLQGHNAFTEGLFDALAEGLFVCTEHCTRSPLYPDVLGQLSGEA